MSVDLTTTIAEYKALMITLRDDLSRFGNLLDGDHLTTVMGPAVKAGVKESAEYLAEVKDNALLGTMTQAHGNQEAILFLVSELMRSSAGRAAKRAVATAKIAVSQGVLATMDNIVVQAGATVTKIEATAKLLLAGAEAKANVITRKRQQAEERFVKSITLVSDKVKLVNNLGKRLEEMSKELNATSSNATIPTEEMYKRIGQISQAQKALSNQKDIAIQAIIQHFGDQTSTGSNSKPELVTLKIPEDMEDGKGKELMANFEIYLNGRVDKFYALMPFLSRVLEDYDHASGACFKPPCIQEKLDEVPQEMRTAYLTQSKSLYVAITAKLSESVKCIVRSTFDYGVDDKPALCVENDGPNLLFALICMFRPCNVEYTEELETTFVDCHTEFPGTDTRAVIRLLRGPLQEAQNLQIPLKWKQTGKRIVDRLVHNDHNMQEALKAFRRLEVADKDTTAQIDKMFAAVEAQCRRNDKQDGKSSAFSLKAFNRPAEHTHAPTKATERAPRAANADRECKFGDNCERYPNCGYKHSKPKGKPEAITKCAGEGCPAKASGSGRKLCTTCYMKVCENGEITLKDGTPFKMSANMKRTALKHELKKAYAVIANHAEAANEDAQELDEDKAPSGVGGPKSSLKRSRAAAATRVDEATKRVKEFAESLGVDFQ
jgi:hypothetical protein